MDPERPEEPLQLGELPTLAISDWATKVDSDISVFKIDDINLKSAVQKVALRFYGENPTKNVSFGLLPLDDDFVSRLPKIVDDDPVFGTVHANIKNTKYPDFLKCIGYTSNNVKRCLFFSRVDLMKLFKAMSEQERQDYAKAISRGNTSKEVQILGSIKKAFFKTDKKM